MYKFIVLVLAILVSSYAADFSQSKKILLKQIYPDHQKTFYCENSYKLDIVDGKEKTVIINDINRYSPRKPNRPESKFVNWEHVMPASKLGSTLVCWKNGGRKACRNDTLFKKMESDMHNLVPSTC
jgi:deoxyribonuclease-1